MTDPARFLSEEEFIAKCAATLVSGAPEDVAPEWRAFLRKRIAEYEEKTGKPVRVLVDGEWVRP